jgi:hypothetical protein
MRGVVGEVMVSPARSDQTTIETSKRLRLVDDANRASVSEPEGVAAGKGSMKPRAHSTFSERNREIHDTTYLIETSLSTNSE